MRSLPPFPDAFSSSSVGRNTPSSRSSASSSSSEKPSPSEASPSSSRVRAPPVGSKSSSGSSVDAGAGLVSAARLSPPPARVEDLVGGIAGGTHARAR